MFTLREAARIAGLGLIALAMTYTTLQVTFFSSSAPQAQAVPASVEPFS
ncbi:MAG: hypothetical protein ACRERR_12735 [Moraxellaceae bacterium]